LNLLSFARTTVLVSCGEVVLLAWLGQDLLLSCAIFLAISTTLPVCLRGWLVPISLLLAKRFDQRCGLDLLLGPFVLGRRRLGDGVCEALEEVLELRVLVDGALAVVVSAAATRQLWVRGVFERGRTDKGGVLPGLGCIVECNCANAVAELLDVVLLGDTDVGAGWLGGFGCTRFILACGVRKPQGSSLLCRDLALLVADPVDLAGTQLPLIAQSLCEFGIGEAWRQSATYQLQARLGRLGAAGRLLGRGILLEECDGQDAIGAGLGGHDGGLSSLVGGSVEGTAAWVGESSLCVVAFKQPDDC
jgi:hypothetical protein